MGRSIGTGERGFTLLELMSIVTIVGILVTMAVPSYQQSVVKAREAVLVRDLFTVRDLLDQHRADKGKYPDSLKDLVTDRKSTRLNSSHSQISYAVFCLKKKKRKK